MSRSTNVRQIKAAIHQQAMRGTRRVNVSQGRVINAKTVKGQLKAKLINGEWVNVNSVSID